LMMLILVSGHSVTAQQHGALPLDTISEDMFDVPSSLTAQQQPEIQDFKWNIHDSTIELIISFNVVPVRYTAFALQKPDRIVLDCFDTEARVAIRNKSLPVPVERTELNFVPAEEKELRLQRLVLFTSRAVAYHIDESPSRLRVIMNWNTRLEEQKIRQARKKRIFWGSLLTSTGLVTAGSVAVLLSVNKDAGPSGPGIIPPPAIAPPNGN